MIDTTPTLRQLEILRYVLDFWFAHGFPPCLRCVASHFGITSPNGVVCHVSRLVAKGHLRRVVVHTRGQQKAVYVPTRPELRVESNGRGGVLVGSAGGPVAFSHERWVAWLRERLAEAGAAT